MIDREKLAKAWDKAFEDTIVPRSNHPRGDSVHEAYFEKFIEALADANPPQTGEDDRDREAYELDLWKNKNFTNEQAGFAGIGFLEGRRGMVPASAVEAEKVRTLFYKTMADTATMAERSRCADIVRLVTEDKFPGTVSMIMNPTEGKGQ